MALQRLLIKFSELLFLLLILSLLFFNEKIYEVFQHTKSFSFALLIPAIASVFLLSRRAIRIPGAALPVIFYLLYIAVLLFTDSKNTEAFRLMIYLSPAAFFLPFLVKFSPLKILAFMAMLAAFSCVYGLFQFFSGIQRPYSFFGNPIFLGEFLGLLLPLITAGLVISSGKTKLFFGAVFSIIPPCLLLTESRGVFISLLISLIVFLSFFSGSLKSALKNAVIPAAVSLVLILLLLLFPAGRNAALENINRINPSLADKGPSPAAAGRALMAKAALPLFFQNPFTGAGPGSYKYYYQKNQSEILKSNPGFNFISTSAAHNDYLQILAETGIAGCLLFLLSVILPAYYAFKKIFYKQKNTFIICAALLSSVTFAAAESFFNFPMFIMPSSVLFWLLLGILIAVCSGTQKLPEKNTKTDPFLKAAVFAAALFFFCVLAFSSRGLLSGFYLKHAVNLDKVHDPANEKYFSTACSFDPKNYYAYFFLGDSLAITGKYEDALTNYKKALNVYPFSADAVYNTGVIHYIRGEFSEAATQLEKAVDLYPDFSGARLYLAKSYIAMGKDQKAAEQLAAAEKASPGIILEDSSKNIKAFFEETGGF